jgi:hypothetical protein
MTLLFVEDNERMTELVQDAVADWNEANEKSGRSLSAVFAADLAGAPGSLLIAG